MNKYTPDQLQELAKRVLDDDFQESPWFYIAMSRMIEVTHRYGKGLTRDEILARIQSLADTGVCDESI